MRRAKTAAKKAVYPRADENDDPSDKTASRPSCLLASDKTAAMVMDAPAPGRKRKSSSKLSLMEGEGTSAGDVSTPDTPKTPFMWTEDIGADILAASPLSSDARSVRFQNPLIVMCEDGILPDDNKMEKPPCESVNYKELRRAMGHAAAEGEHQWATVSSFLGPGVGKGPVLLATIAGMFLCIPSDGYRMQATDNVDVLVYKRGVVVKKPLSPQYLPGRFCHEVGSEPAPRKKRKEKLPVVRYKTDIVVQARNEQGCWIDRISIEHKGASSHGNDRWESLSAACRTMKKGIMAKSLEPRHYVLLWGEERLHYYIADGFGLVNVEDGRITDSAYDEFLGHYKAAKEYMCANFPSESVKQWVSGVDALPGATPNVWKEEESDADPFTKSRVRWYLAYQQQELIRQYNCTITDGKHLIGTTYFQPRKANALGTGECSFNDAAWLTLSVLRIVMGDQVLHWKYDNFVEAMELRRLAMLWTGAANSRRNLKDGVNVFEVESMGTSTRQEAEDMGGGWKVTETAEAWVIKLYWTCWQSNGQSIALRKSKRRTWVQICEGDLDQGLPVVPRIVEVNFPTDIVSVRKVHNNDEYQLTLVCTKAVIEPVCIIT